HRGSAVARRGLCGGGPAPDLAPDHADPRHLAARHRRQHHSDYQRGGGGVLDRALDAPHELPHVQRHGELPLHVHLPHGPGRRAVPPDAEMAGMVRGVRFSLIALGLLVATGIAVAMPVRVIETPLRASLEAVPAPPGWRVTDEAPETILRPDGRAPVRLARGYAKGAEKAGGVGGDFPIQE